MTDNWTLLQNELAKYKGTLVYNVDNTITRLKDVVEEPDDYYWVMERIDGAVTMLSCVGSPEFLYGSLSDAAYQALEDTWAEGQRAIADLRSRVDARSST